MAKLSRHYFSELPKDVQGKVKEEFSANFNPAYLTGEYSDDDAEVGAEVVLDEDDNLYDIRVFDPYNRVQPRKDGDGLMRDQTVYIGSDGWSHWLFAYTDPAGNDVDEIIENYDGKPQSASYDFPDYVTPDDEDDTYFYVYLSDMEKYWIEEYGQDSWDNVSFEYIDMEIQTNNPELWYVGNGSNDRGEYFSYTTDERQAYK